MPDVRMCTCLCMLTLWNIWNYVRPKITYNRSLRYPLSHLNEPRYFPSSEPNSKFAFRISVTMNNSLPVLLTWVFVHCYTHMHTHCLPTPPHPHFSSSLAVVRVGYCVLLQRVINWFHIGVNIWSVNTVRTLTHLSAGFGSKYLRNSSYLLVCDCAQAQSTFKTRSHTILKEQTSYPFVIASIDQ